jgi:hypothetical protein
VDPRLSEHPDNSCSLSTESGTESSYDQIGESFRYNILSALPSSTSGDAPKLVDGSDATYWEPGVDVGGEFVLDVGQVYELATHVRIVSSNVDSFDVAVYSSYQGSQERTYRNNFTATPGTDVYTLGVEEDVVTTQVDKGARLYWIYIAGKTGANALLIHEVAALSRSGPNPAWGMSDALGGRSFLGNVKCCDVPSSNRTNVVLSNIEGGGSDVGGWSCVFRDEEMDSVRGGLFIDTWYDTSDGCEDPATGGVPCTQQVVDSDVECANRCGIVFARLTAAAAASSGTADDASMWSYNDAAQECVCKRAVPSNNATMAFIPSATSTSGKSSTCSRTEYSTCSAAYQAGSTKSGAYYINGRNTYCDMEIHGGGWELIANAAGTGAWPNFGDTNFEPDATSYGSYDDHWDFSTASSRFTAPNADYKRGYSHLLDAGVVNDDVEMLFMTGDRSYWCVLRQVDVTQEQLTLTKLNAQVLGSSQSSGTAKGGWTNVRMDYNKLKDPIVQCEGAGMFCWSC